MTHRGPLDPPDPSRRQALAAGVGLAAAVGLPLGATAADRPRTRNTIPSTSNHTGQATMSTIVTKDGTTIFFKDWGPKTAQPIVFHHGWPLSSDDWDAQMLFFLLNGYRVVAHDRRGHGRSAAGERRSRSSTTMPPMPSAVFEKLDLRNAVHIGHSTGGGEVARYVAKFGEPAGPCGESRPGRRPSRRSW